MLVAEMYTDNSYLDYIDMQPQIGVVWKENNIKQIIFYILLSNLIFSE